MLDFGIAKLLDAAGDASDLTRTGRPLLTPAYAASSDPLTTRAVGQLGLALASRDGEADVVEARATLERAARMLEAPAELPGSYARAAAETLREVRAAQQRLGTRARTRRPG